MSRNKNIDLTDLVAERLQKSELGTLFKEEELFDIVKEAIDRTFFKPYTQVEGINDYNKKIVEYPSRLEYLAQKQFEKVFAEKVAETVKGMEEEVKEKFAVVIEEQLAKVTLDAVVMGIIQQVFKPSIDTMTMQMQMHLQNYLMNMGR